MQVDPDDGNLLAKVGISDLDRRVLKSIRCPAACRGLLLALLLIEAALLSYYKVCNLPRVAAWLDVIQALVKSVQTLEKGGVVGLSTAAPASQANAYSRLCTSYPIRLAPECHERALAILGMLIADAVSQGRPIPEPAIAGWYTLIQNGGKSADWKAFKSTVPTSLHNLNAALETAKSPGLIDLLSAVVAAVGRPLSDPERQTLGPTDPVGAAAAAGTEKDSLLSPQRTLQDDKDVDDGEDDPQLPLGGSKARGPLETEQARKNPVNWQVAAANFALHIQRFDLIGHVDRLHPEVTSALWKELKHSFLCGGEQEKVFVAFAHVSQRLAQPGRIALELRLDGTNSTQLDVAAGETIWNCRAALTESAEPALDSLNQHDGSFAMHQPLDADIADYLRLCLVERPWASTLAELLGIESSPDARKTWLKSYRRFLRQKGSTLQVPYDSRFANSLGDVYRCRGGGEVMGFYGGLDFDALPIGMAHYITLKSEFTTPIENDVMQYLGWRMPSGWAAPTSQGTPVSITGPEFRTGWAECQQKTALAREDLSAATTAEEFVDAFNRLSRLRLLAVITLSAHRGTLLSRLTWRALYQHAAVVSLYDKDVGDYQSDRGIPVHRRLDQVLSAWQGDLLLMRAKAKELGLTTVSDGRRALPAEAPNDPVFFTVRATKTASTAHLERAALRAGSVSDMAMACFEKPLNIGRHFLISQLIAARVSAWHVRVLTGHCRIHAEAFADGMHTPPAHAFAVLHEGIEKVLDGLDLDPVAGLDIARSGRRLINPSGSLPGASDRYLAPSAANVFRVLPPPFDPYTTVALQVVEEQRRRLCGVTGLSAAAEFTAAQTLFGLWDRVDQETVFSNLPGCIFKVGEVACAVWHRPESAQPIGLTLNDRSVIALTRVQDHATPGDWRASAAEVGRWASTTQSSLAWPDEDFDAYLCLHALALRFRRFHFSPASLTAASPALPSATFSMRSLLRVAGQDPDPPKIPENLGKALRQGSPRQIEKSSGPLHDVANALRKVSRIDYPLGGEIKRTSDWRAALEHVDLKDDLRAKALKRVHECEISLWQKQNKKEADETSTLAGHLPEILTAMNLLSPRDDIAEFTELEWREWIDAAKQVVDDKGKYTKAVEQNLPRHFGLKRFVRVARMLNWSVPRRMFTVGGQRYTFDGLRRSAASVALMDADHAKVQHLLADHFDDWPVLQWQAMLAAALLQHHPLRSAEQAALVRDCVVRESGMLMIAPGKFSHLKTVHAYRLQECAKEVIDLLDKLDAGLKDHRSKYLFLDNSGWNWSDARLIDDALVSAAAQVTGEASVRKHSWRGSAYLRLLWPCWEPVARSLFSTNCSPEALGKLLGSEWARGFSSAARAARSAGHGLQLIGLVYYAAAWPLLHAGQSRALLAGLTPDSKLIEGVLSSTGSIRNAKSAAKSTGIEFDAWSEVARRCVKRMNLAQLVPTDQRAVMTPRSEGSDTAELPLAARIRLVAGLIVGGDRDSLANELGIPKPYAMRLEAMLPDAQRLAAITRRRRGEATRDQLAEDRKFMDPRLGNPLAGELLASLISQPFPALMSLLIDLAPYRRNPRDAVPSAEALATRLKSHLKVLPAPLRLQIRFSTRHGRLLNAEQQHSLGSRLEIGADDPRAGGQPQCQVLPAPKALSDESLIDGSKSQHAQSELVGRLTVITRVYVEAMDVVLSAMKGAEQ